MTYSLAWFDIQLQLPREWEVVRYSTNPKQGSFSFATRNGWEANWSWRQCDREPDLERTLFETQKRSIEITDKLLAKSLTRVKTQRAGIATFAYHNSNFPAQAAFWIESKKKLHHITFPNYDPVKLDQIWRPFLKTISPNIGERRLWALFGTAITLPESFVPSEVSPLPAAVSIRYETPKHHQITVYRWGLPKWRLAAMNESEFLRLVLLKTNAKVDDIVPERMNGHKGAFATFTRRGQYGFERMVGRWWNGQAWLWHNADEQRIYAVEETGPKRVERLNREGIFS